MIFHSLFLTEQILIQLTVRLEKIYYSTTET